MKRPAVLMTDPEHYAVKFGENPHTRSADGTLKSVDAATARRQWERYVDTLRDHGVDVYVTGAKPDLTGMVFAANAGFLHRRLHDVAPAEKTFYASHFMVEHRRPEQALFEAFMRDFGFAVADYDDTLRFEGEADGFPVGATEDPDWVFTHGFRSDAEVSEWLDDVTGARFHPLRLTDPRFYHGDCLLCSLGDHVMAYPGGLDTEDWAALCKHLGDRVLELTEEDATRFVGNSFHVEVDGEQLLFATDAIGDRTRGAIEERGARVVPVDISEFFGKGGGGPKCMVFNLGLVDPEEEGVSDDVLRFRAERRRS